MISFGRKKMLAQQKEQLRKQIIQKREALTPDQIRELSLKVIENLKGLKSFQKAKTVMLYYPHRGEVDLTPLFEEVLKKEKKLLLPKVVGEEIFPIEVEDLSLLSKGKFNIVEPIGGKIYQPQKVDFVAVPGLAFDLSGCRLGFGGGYYDRFLPRVKGAKVGIAYDFQIFDRLPCEKHDVKLNQIVTPTRVITPNNP
jgi:5-formyltetrahydrofolate cyclo-ligase